MIRSPARSKRSLIAPVRLRRVASGLMIDRVRSTAMTSLALLEGAGYSGAGGPRQSGQRPSARRPARQCWRDAGGPVVRYADRSALLFPTHAGLLPVGQRV